MSFLVASLILLAVSLIALLILNSHEKDRLELINQYRSDISLWIGILLIFIGIIYLMLFLGLVAVKFSVLLPHLIGVALLYIPAATLLLIWLMLKLGFTIEPSLQFLNTVTYIAVTWILLQHIEMLIEPQISYIEFGVIALIVSFIILFASFSLLRYRNRMKNQMLLPLDLVPLLNGIFITFSFISLAGVSASLGLFLTHVLSCLIGAIVIIFFVGKFLKEVRIYLK